MSTGKRSGRKRNVNMPVLLLIVLAAAVLAVLSVSSGVLGRILGPAPSKPENVQIFDGTGYIWITPDSRLNKSTLSVGDFTQDANGEQTYIGEAFEVRKGVDVSEYQGEIDWAAVRESGVSFAILRAGGRYYGSEGELFTDESFKRNLEGARSAGLDVGVYFFSQAINAEEARVEAELVIEQLGGALPELPVFFDWETIGTESARTDSVDGDTATDCAIAFCERIESAGLKSGVYLYDHTAYHVFELGRFAGRTLWYAAQDRYPTFYYEHGLWQYHFSGTVPGIDAPCDLNMMFVKK